MEVIVLWLLLCLPVAILAKRWGRSGIGYLVFAFMLSPIVAGAFLLASGKTLKCRADEAFRLEEYVASRRAAKAAPPRVQYGPSPSLLPEAIVGGLILVGLILAIAAGD